MRIALDFDGTLVEHKYPEIGNELPFAVATVRKLQEEGHEMVLWTVREGKYLEEAVEWCKQRGIFFYAINANYPDEEPTDKDYTRKILADLIIDDRNVGGLPSWSAIYQMVHNDMTAQKYYQKEERERVAALESMKLSKKKSWWPF